jgi:hypothetical protein
VNTLEKKSDRVFALSLSLLVRVELGKPIAIIFKNSIENKNIPNEWREGCITALFKKGSRKMASNFRPVSLT